MVVNVNVPMSSQLFHAQEQSAIYGRTLAIGNAVGDASGGVITHSFQFNYKGLWVVIYDVNWATDDTNSANIDLYVTTTDWDEFDNVTGTPVSTYSIWATGSQSVNAGNAINPKDRMRPFHLGRQKGSNPVSVILRSTVNTNTKNYTANLKGLIFRRPPAFIPEMGMPTPMELPVQP